MSRNEFIISTLFLGLLAATPSQTHVPDTQINSEACGISSFSGGIGNRIFYGTNVVKGEFPWVVNIHLTNGAEISFPWCTGALITSTFVLTAAHCLRTTSQNLYIVASMGEVEVNPENFIKAPIVFPHQDFIFPATNDIGLMRLEHPVQFTDLVRPICLTPTTTDFINKYAIISGYGRMDDKGQNPGILQKGISKIVENAECERISLHLNDKEICVDNMGDSRVCPGDSGGALFYQENGRYYAIGVVSRGDTGECSASRYAVFTEVNSYIGWIKEAMALMSNMI